MSHGINIPETGYRSDSSDSESAEIEQSHNDYDWDPNYICDITSLNQSKPLNLAREERNLRLVSKVMSLEKPVVTRKMVAFLSQDSVPPLLCNFLTRATPFADEKYNGGPPETTPRAGTSFDIEDEKEVFALKVGHRAMNLLTASGVETMAFVEDNLYVIIPELFRIFEPSARGNFHHMLFVVKKLAGLYAEDVLTIVKENHLLCAALPYVHIAPVAELVVLLLTSGMEMPLVRMELYQQLASCNFLPRLIKMFMETDDPDRASYYLYFLLQLVDNLQAEIHADILFATLGDGKLLDIVVTACGIHGDFEPFRRRLCVEFIHTLLKKSEKSELSPLRIGGKPVKLHNMVAVLQKSVVDAVCRHYSSIALAAVPKHDMDMDSGVIGSDTESPSSPLPSSPSTPRTRRMQSRRMSDMLLPSDTQGNGPGVRYGKYHVSRLFTSERLLLLEILSHVAAVTSDDCLDQLQPYFWKRLVDWLIEYPHNSLYHNAFFQMFRVAVLADHWPSMVALLGCNLIDTIHDAYLNHPDLKGHAILLGNMLRLKAETQAPAAFLRKRLAASKVWKEFVVALIEETEIQAGSVRLDVTAHRTRGAKSPDTANESENETASGGDTADTDTSGTDADAESETISVTKNFAPPLVLPLGANGKPKKESEAKEVEGGPGVNLGSVYANKLGFVGASVFDSEEDSDIDRLAQEMEEELEQQEKPDGLWNIQ